MDLRHYDSNGLELSSVLLFEVGLISIVIKKLIAVAMTISYSIATDALLFTHICPFIYYPNVKSKRVIEKYSSKPTKIQCYTVI